MKSNFYFVCWFCFWLEFLDEKMIVSFTEMGQSSDVRIKLSIGDINYN